MKKNFTIYGRAFGTVAIVVAITTGILTSVYYLTRTQAYDSTIDSQGASTTPVSSVKTSPAPSSSTSLVKASPAPSSSTSLVKTSPAPSSSTSLVQTSPAPSSSTSLVQTSPAPSSSVSASSTPDRSTAKSTESAQRARIETEVTLTIEQQPPEQPLTPPTISSIESGGSNLPDAVQVANKPAAPTHQLRQEGTIQLVGIVKETRIQNSQYAQDLEQLWLQYAESETLFSLENTVDNKTYVAYLNYSENRDRFTIIIGHRVANFDTVPAGLSQITIPATTYAQFNIMGNLDEAIPKTWEAIETSNLKRAYSTDLEVYDYQQENVAEIWASVN